MRHIGKIEFYITNVCNLTCEQCNRFNNYDFRGWQRWSDHQADHTEWAKRITLDGIIILGGEPLLNPTITDWVRGLNRTFDKSVQILSNGTRLNAVPGLYDAMHFDIDGRPFEEKNWIGITAHHIDDVPKHIDAIHQFLQGPIKDITSIDRYGAKQVFIDKNKTIVRMWLTGEFGTSSIRPASAVPEFHQLDTRNRLALHNNDPVQAHQECGFATWKNYHMIRGKLYKCGPVALLPEFDQQFSLMLSDEDRALLNSYKPLSPWDDDQIHDKFFAELDNPIPQCKFCPTQKQREWVPIRPVTKKRGSTSPFD
jgi:organic radical activating enzyme